MNKTIQKLTLTLSLSLGVTVLTGCVQFPTEKASVADMRAQISFQVASEDASLQSARVYVNGLESGKVGDFIEGKAALRVLAGNNVIRVVDGSRIVMDQQVYLGDGVGRSFRLK